METGADPLAGGVRAVWYGDQPVKVPHLCCCCGAYMVDCVGVALATRDEESPDYVELPMPYCHVCFIRRQKWRAAEQSAIMRALWVFVVPALVLVVPLLWVGWENLAEGLVWLAVDLTFGLGISLFARRYFDGPPQLSGHTPFCDAVRSEACDAFQHGNRPGGVLLFVNWRFGGHWAELNGIIERPRGQPLDPP